MSASATTPVCARGSLLRLVGTGSGSRVRVHVTPPSTVTSKKRLPGITRKYLLAAITSSIGESLNEQRSAGHAANPNSRAPVDTGRRHRFFPRPGTLDDL